MKNIFLTLFIFLLIGCSGSNSTKKASSSDGKPTIIRFESSDLYENIGGFKSLVPKYNENGPTYLFRVLKNKPYDEDGYQFQQAMAEQDEYGNYRNWDKNVGKKFIVSKAFYDEVQKFDNIKYITGATMDDIMNNTAVARTEIGITLNNIVKSCGEDTLWWLLGDENSNSRDCIVKMPGEVISINQIENNTNDINYSNLREKISRGNTKAEKVDNIDIFLEKWEGYWISKKYGDECGDSKYHTILWKAKKDGGNSNSGYTDDWFKKNKWYLSIYGNDFIIDNIEFDENTGIMNLLVTDRNGEESIYNYSINNNNLVEKNWGLLDKCG